jgi:hypothetical protein
MTDDERKSILATIAKAREKTQKMSQEQARKRLVDEGLYDENGRLSVQYGGKIAARG